MAALVLSALAMLSSLSLAAAIQGTTYAQLAPVAHQWSISVNATKQADKSIFVPQTGCNNTATDGCNLPLLQHDSDDALQFTFTLKNGSLVTIDNLTPQMFIFKACYSQPFLKNRAWRAVNVLMDKDKSCPYVLKTQTPNVSTVSVTWPIPDNMTYATWYAAVYVTCQNGTVSSYCQYDSSKNSTYFGTQVINSVPKGLEVATALCSTIGPLILGAYFLYEYIRYRRAK